MKLKGTIRLFAAQKLLLKKKFFGSLGAAGVFILAMTFLAYPAKAHAFDLGSFFKTLFGFGDESAAQVVPEANAKPFPFLAAVPNTDPKGYESRVELQVVDDTTLAPAVGPMGNVVDAAESSASYQITTYTVRKGDSLPLIAKTFGVSVSTIRWANNISPKGGIKEGDQLVILPVSGVVHTVKKGETIASIAKKYGGDPDDIVNFNGLTDGEGLAVGSEIIVPDGELAAESSPSTSSGGKKPTVVRGSGPELAGYFLRPLVGGIKTRGIHGYNGIDIGTPIGSTIRASASGTVIIARSEGWNGGYGKYVVISHPNGTQTLYGHLSQVNVVPGQAVAQGVTIGLSGNTGRSTGPHLHFEVRGAKNPF